MSIDYPAFLDVAKRLSTSQNEADWRSAVSRAYYSVLHGVTTALPAGSLPDDSFNGSGHERIIAATKGYGNSLPPPPGRGAAIRVADKLSRLKAKRKKADYRLDAEFSEVYMKQAILEAESALNDCIEWIDKRNEAPA